MALKAKIYSCPYKGIAAEELRRLMKKADLTVDELYQKMDDLNVGWSKSRLRRYRSGEIECHLHPVEMQALLDCLGATSI